MKRVSRVRPPRTAVVAAYVAGIIDGEGSITLHASFAKKSKHVSHNCRVNIAGTDGRLAVWLSDTFGGSLYYSPRTLPLHKPCFHWRLYGENARRFLEVIEPYLLLKREQARLVIAFQRSRASQRNGVALEPAIVAERQALKIRMHVLISVD